MTKVFGIGFHKTGTKSLGRALEILGYRVCGPIGVQEPNVANKLPQLAFKYIPQFDAFQDNPWAILYQELDQYCPNSKFILTVRPVEQWIHSVMEYFGSQTTPMRELIYGKSCGSPMGNEQIYIQRYIQHNQSVLDYFRERPSDLLVIKLTEGETWEPLCSFLKKPIPSCTFPHENKKRF